MKQGYISRELALLGTFTAITVLTWLGFDIYRAFKKPIPPTVPVEQLEHLDPKLDTTVIEKLSGRMMFSREELSVPPPSPTPIATQSATFQTP